MDERLKKALDVANLMVTFNSQRDLIKQEFKENCFYHEEGHRFTIDRELINFLSTIEHRGYLEDFVITDDFENPYMIPDVKEFLDKILNQYIESANNYYHKFVKLKSTRSIEKIMEIDE